MFLETLDAYFADFGVDCTVDGVAAKGIFDQTYLQSLGFVSGNNPVLVVTDAVVVAVDDAVVIDAVNYTVASKQPDGTGIVLLELEQV